jgi:hypothetical protein
MSYLGKSAGILSIRHDSSDSIRRGRAAANPASAPVGGRRAVDNDPDIRLITREHRGPAHLGDGREVSALYRRLS